MPLWMGGYVQSAVVQGRVYVGGGFAGIGTSDADCMVMEYETSSGKWSKLPFCRTSRFAMTVIDDQLVLVGGRGEGGNKSKGLGAWRDESKEWIYPYPEMHTAR